MATKLKTTMGTMSCLCCGHDIPVKQSENGTINLSCTWCDFTGYVKAGTESHGIVTGKVKGKPAQAPAPVDKPEPTPAPAPRKPRSVFDL